MVSTLSLRRPSQLVAALLAVLVLGALAPPVAAATGRWIVPADTPLPRGSVIVGAFPVANAVLVSGPMAPADAAAYDTPLGWRSLTGEQVEGEPRVDSGVATTRAPDVWASSEIGSSAVVALVDTGVAPIPALEGAVAGEIDFSGDGGGDGYGHGTFMASLIAGRGDLAPGVAPGAGILSLKVAENDGSTTLGSVLSALQWLHGPGRAAGIRIATLALGVDSDTPAGELLDAATDTLAARDVLVVTAAGNDGPGNVTSPATATSTFSVGATDDRGTAAWADDAEALSDGQPFSGTGPDRVGVQQPDVSTSGVRVLGWMPEDSVIGQSYPQSFTAEGLFPGTGTSMATALTAGVAALVSSARPDLGGQALGEALLAGDGRVDAVAAVAAADELDAAGPSDNGRRPATAPAKGPKNGKGHSASPEPNAVRWVAVRWVAVRWVAVRWVAVRWVGDHWGDESWSGRKWGAVRWVGHWAGDVGDGSDFAAVRWVGAEYAAVRWVGTDYAAVRWVGADYAAVRWVAVRWAMLPAAT